MNHWPDECIDMLNKHWLVEKREGSGILQSDIIKKVYRISDDGAKLVNATLNYINGYSEFLKRRNKYNIDDAKKVLAMMDKIVEMYTQHIKTERKKEILDCAKKYET
jgi:DNA-binding PadR family transcriptional regulator